MTITPNIVAISLTDLDNFALGHAEAICHTLANKIEAGHELVSQETGECISYDELMRVCGILNGLYTSREWSISEE